MPGSTPPIEPPPPVPPAAPVPPDPLAALSERRLVRLARRAARARRREGAALERLALRLDVPSRRLRLLADALAAGGPSGITALGPAPARPGIAALDGLEDAVESWRRRHHPHQVLRCDVWRNRVTLWHVLAGRHGELDRRPLAHLRVTPDGRWHLYRKAVQGEWWPVRVKAQGGSRRGTEIDLDACLEVLRLDPTGAFWGVEPPAPEGSDELGPERFR